MLSDWQNANPSDTRVDQSKTVEVKIMQNFTLRSSLSRIRTLHAEILTNVFPLSRGDKMVGKQDVF